MLSPAAKRIFDLAQSESLSNHETVALLKIIDEIDALEGASRRERAERAEELRERIVDLIEPRATAPTVSQA